MINLDECIRILNTPNLSNLTKNECKVYAILFSLIFNSLIIFTILIMYMKYSIFEDYYLPLALFFLNTGISLFAYNFTYLNKKYDIKTSEKLDYSYQYIVIFKIFFIPFILILGLIITRIFHSLSIGSGFILAFAVTYILMFNQYKVFNDKSKKIGYYGYNPKLYSLTSIIIGLNGYIACFKYLNQGFVNNFLLGVLITLIFQMIIIYPNKLNKILPWELKNKKVCEIILISILSIYFLFYLIMNLIFI